jgi:hypothetical protein
MLTLGPFFTRVSEQGGISDGFRDTGYVVEYTTAQFDWTPLALMTTPEAREARITFVRQHPELADSPEVLARALKEAGLYSTETSVHQIAKNLPNLVGTRNSERPE